MTSEAWQQTACGFSYRRRALAWLWEVSGCSSTRVG